ncbi:unnamed protein product [Cyclocybe aegerita]|uniref:Manganese lipoxygenase n=1 Tax=Cyclocybe aegerita TaxID=1973307 RepID=A0A8S0W608_CYCAE|nr:unnamed protein product [Cyclocybe aegerita]
MGIKLLAVLLACFKFFTRRSDDDSTSEPPPMSCPVRTPDGRPLPRLPYMKRREAPTTYHDALKLSVEGFKDMRSMLDWFFDVADFQPIARSLTTTEAETPPQTDEDNLKKKRALYQWELNDSFPPHLRTVPSAVSQPATSIFKFKRLYDSLQAVYPWLPDVDFFRSLAPSASNDMASLERRNKLLHYTTIGTMYTAENIGLREDWFTDAVFAQQQFIGVNPCTITAATPQWIQAFTKAATDQGNAAAAQLIAASTNSFYVQDYSNYRSAAGMGPTQTLTSDFGDTTGHQPRFGCASVVLFQLLPNGKLHPIAVVLDYKGSIDANISITVFNKRLSPTANWDQKNDWPWRYAKMCAQVSDWTRHELAVHLVHTHFVEEATIVAAQRSFPDSHIVFALLSPHWITTLSLNALAREVLVPSMVAPISYFKIPEIFAICNDAYHSFDFVGSYVPNDMKRRGFDVSQFDDPKGKFHNYAYGRDVAKMWDVLRKFVSSVLTAHYKGGDAEVAADKYVAGFCTEMQSSEGGGLSSFPTIKTLDDLVDVVTMCIHIAAPQHTAVNYLQQFYLTFVPNKPSALFAPLPKSLKELQGYKEQDILKALPLQSQVSWLMMAQVPYLLSAEVEPENNIITYAGEAASNRNPLIAQAGKVLQKDVATLGTTFRDISDQMDDQGTKYKVLDPVDLASAIII